MLLLLFTHAASSPELRVPSFLSSNMVLQRDGAQLWGWAPASAVVTVAVRDTATNALLAEVNTTANSSTGAWLTTLLSIRARTTSATVSIAAPGESTIVLNNTLFGDVLLCSGQSNMAYPVADAFDGPSERAASNYPLLRMFNVRDTSTSAPATDCPSKAPYIWAASAPATLSKSTASGMGADFPSAACWFAARDLLESNTSVPVGIITAAWSGSSIQSWMPKMMLLDGQSLALGGNGTCGGTVPAHLGPAAAKPCTDASKSGGMFNGMIAPLLPMRLAAILWYQGEANDGYKKAQCVGEAEYECLFPAMISGWRARFGQPSLPFFYVLLAAGHTAELREAQYTGAGALHATAFASAMDIGASAEEETIPGHPPRKQEVGRRLNLALRAVMRGEAEVDYRGPAVLPSKTVLEQGAVSTRVVLAFDVGSNGYLHLNDTAACNHTAPKPNASSSPATATAPALLCCTSPGKANANAPVQFRDPDAIGAKASVATHATAWTLDSGAGTLTATLSPPLHSEKGRIEVRFLFDDAPLCALYNGDLSGPDSYYAAVPHFGVVAQSWRANLTANVTNSNLFGRNS